MDSPLTIDSSGYLDSTLVLTHALFEIIPAAIIVFISPFYIYKACHSTPVCTRPKLFFAKLALATALAALQVTSALVWWRLPLETSCARIASLMTCLTAICTWIIVYVGHLHFVRSPHFLSIFLGATLLCEVAMTYTYTDRTGLHAPTRLHTPILALKLALVIFEEISKRMMPREERSSLFGPETTEFCTKTLFRWINANFLIGFRRVASQQDLASIDPRFDAETLQDEFVRQWENVDQESETALLEACFFTIPSVFVSIILPRILIVVFNYSLPFLLGEVVYAAGFTNLRGSVINGLVSATALIYGGRVICSAWYRYIKNQISISIRAIIIGAIYRKSLRLSTEESTQAAAVTLMSSHVNTIEKVVSLTYESGGRVLEIAAGLIALQRYVGLACIFTLIPAVLVSLLSTKLSSRMHSKREQWNKYTMERMADTSNALAQIKEIMMMGLGPTMEKRLQAKQKVEIAASMGERAAWSAIIALAAFVETVTPAVVVGATIFWTKSLSELSAPNFFSALALIAMITTPLSFLLGNLGYWAPGFASLARIQSYLLQDEVEDSRVLVQEASRRPSTTTGSSLNSANGVVVGRSRSRRRSRQILFAVQMAGVAVTYDTSAPILRDINLNFPINRRTMIFGTAGCGKTTLLKALLGEVTIRGGSVSLISKLIAFCGQSPFIQLATIKSNIIGPNPFDAAWLHRVLWICALDAEVNSFASGIEMLVGGDDCTLTDGQKIRISLARALYSKPEILLLDDIFSHLDVEASSTVRIRLFSQTGVLRSNSITLIMTTSMTAHLVDADIVVGLTTDGKAMVLSNGVRETTPSSFPVSVLPPQEDEPEVIAIDGNPNEKSELPAVSPSSNTEAPWNHPSSRYGEFSLYWYFLRPAAFWFLIPWTAAVSVAALAERMPQIYVRFWLDRNPDNQLHYVSYVFFTLASPLCNFLAGECYYCLVNPRTTEGLHRKLVGAAFNTQLDSLTEENAESLLKRLSLDISIASQRLPLGIMPTCWMAVTVLVDAWMIASGANHAAPILPFFMLLLAVLLHNYLPTFRQLRFMELDTSKLLHGHFTKTITGLEHLRAFQWEPYSQMEFYSILRTAQNAFYCLLAIQQWLQVILNTSCMGVALVLVYLALNSPGAVSQSTLDLALLSLITFSDTMGIFIGTWTDMDAGLGAVARTRSFIQQTPQEKDRRRTPALPRKWPSSGKVDFNCVSASYQSQSETPCIALNNVSVSIGPGEKVAITGPRGSGKSSVFVCLLSLLQYSGSISIDDREIRAVPRDILRSQITTITQSGLELMGSVKFNLNPFGFACATDDILSDVLRRVGLLRVVDSRGGLDAGMGKMKFSRVQKLLFQIARAIVHKQGTDSKLVLIDEGSVSMDDETETLFQSLVDKEFSDCTVLTATHRPRALENIDLLLRLDTGRATVYRLDQRSGQVVQVR